VDTIHRLQKAYPYNVRDISKKWAMCAKNAVDLSREDRETCADHFVWLVLMLKSTPSYLLTCHRKCTRALTLRICGRCSSARLIKLTATLERRLNAIAPPRIRCGIQASTFVSTRCSTTYKCMIASSALPKLSSPLDHLHGNTLGNGRRRKKRGGGIETRKNNKRALLHASATHADVCVTWH
jgi:hypothetical protein